MQLSINDISYYVGNTPLLTSLTVVFGDGVNCILGPNGAGKSTLLRIIATSLPSRSGEMSISGPSATKRLGRDDLGYVPQTFAFYPHFTVRQLVEYVAALKGVPRSERASRIEEAIAGTNLEQHADKKLSALSGGMLRRAAIAQAVVNKPSVLVLDEPTVGLDPDQRAAFLGLLAKLSSERIVLLSTHLVDDVRMAGSNVSVMRSGQIVAH